MIEPTDEMVQLALDIFLATPTDSIAQIDAGMRDALAAAFDLVERDYGVERRCPHGHPGARRCGPCSFDAVERDHDEREEWASMVAAEREDEP